MKWADPRERHPHRWTVVEALAAHSDEGRRMLEELALVDTFDSAASALEAYLRLHRQAPDRELYVIHTDREHLDIAERSWLGLRTAG